MFRISSQGGTLIEAQPYPELIIAVSTGLGAFAVCWLCNLLTLNYLPTHLFHDRPGNRKGHLRITPRAGGLCIVATFLLFLLGSRFISLLNGPTISPDLYPVLLFASLTIPAIGLPDDISFLEISNSAKFLLEIVVAVEVIVLLDMPLPHVEIFGLPAVPPWIIAVFSVVWIVGVANAVNIIDGVDGLAATMVIPSFATIGIIGYTTGELGLTLVSLIIIALVAGFLMHNISPARMFLGDTGSLFLGLTLGIHSLYAVSSGSRTADLVVAPLAVGVPILDISTAMLRRFCNKIRLRKPLITALKAMTKADNYHIHHRLLAFGFSHTETWIVLLFFQCTVCALAFLAMQAEWPLTLTAVLYLTVPTFWMLKHLNYLKNSMPWIYPEENRPQQRKHTVGVLFADPILKYSLQRHEQDILHFKFYEDEIDSDVHHAAFVVNSTSSTTFSRDVRLGEELSEQLRCPIVVVTEERKDDEIEELLKVTPGKGVYYISKPLYIPLFLEEVYQVFSKYNPTRSAEIVVKETQILRPVNNEQFS